MDQTGARKDRPRRTRAPGERSRRRVLEQAAKLATVEGLDGLSIGRLASAIGMPKSSVYQLFGSKEDLQMATIDAARESFIHEVVVPGLTGTTPGRDRLLGLCDGFLSYVERRVFPGGCFFVGAAAEMGGRRGRVAERIAEVQKEWGALLLAESVTAAQQAELAADTDPDQLAFELGTLLAGANILSVLHDDVAAVARARASVRARLGVS